MNYAALAVALSLAASVPSAAPPAALAQNLVANPLMVRDLPPPGWLADRRAEWVKQHPVYRSTCRTPDVVKEIEFLNRVVGRDENLLVLAGSSSQDNSAQAREAQLAQQDTGMLRNDITAADGLVAQLQVLPACGANSAAVTAAPPPPAPSSPTRTASPSPSVFVIRFDDRLLALTPSGIHALQQAIDAARAGKPVRIAIDGCNSSADFLNGSPCARRLMSLEHRLAEAGIKDPSRLFAAAR